MANKFGKIVAIIGPVLDCEFEAGHLPDIYNALRIEVPGTGGAAPAIIIAEVEQHLGENRVRAVAMKPTDGLQRGMKAEDLGAPISVPVGPQTLGRVLNVLGEPVDFPDRPVQSISAEQTFEHDLPAALVEAALPALAEQVWRAAARADRVGRTVVLKLKTADFRVLSRHVTPPHRPQAAADVLDWGRRLLTRMPQDPALRYRLAGLGLTNFVDLDDARQPTLFGAEDTLAAAPDDPASVDAR